MQQAKGGNPITVNPITVTYRLDWQFCVEVAPSDRIQSLMFPDSNTRFLLVGRAPQTNTPSTRIFRSLQDRPPEPSAMPSAAT